MKYKNHMNNDHTKSEFNSFFCGVPDKIDISLMCCFLEAKCHKTVLCYGNGALL